MILVLINFGILLALLTQKKSKKRPVAVALLFGTIKIFLVLAVGFVVAADVGFSTVLPEVAGQALLRGVISFFAAWAMLALLKRIDDIEVAARLAPAGVIAKPRSVALEWCGVVVAALVCGIF